MLRKLALVALVPAMLVAGPALAVTAKEKKQTCEIGAKDQNLTGKAANDFIRKCMGKGNYEPPARKDAMKKQKAMKKSAMKNTKKKPAMKKPAAKPAAKPDDKKQ